MITLTKKYDDKTLVSLAERALVGDPIIDHSVIEVQSNKGVVTVTGNVRSEREHQRAMTAVRRSIEHSGLKYVRIIDQVKER